MPLAQRRTILALLSFAVALATVVALLLTSGAGVIEAQGQPPPGPVTYTGTITIGGAPAPDGLMIVGRIPTSARQQLRIATADHDGRWVQEPDCWSDKRHIQLPPRQLPHHRGGGNWYGAPGA